MPALFRLLLIADLEVVLDLDWAVRCALSEVPPGSVAVSLRARQSSARQVHEAAVGLRRITREKGAPLLVGDRIDVAMAVDADGIHLPEDGLPVTVGRALVGSQKLICAAAHSAEGAERRAREGADLVLLGPIHATASHPGVPPLGIPALAAGSRRAKPVPLFAIGGITPENALAAARAGASGVAVIRSVLTDRDPAGATRAILSCFGITLPEPSTAP